MPWCPKQIDTSDKYDKYKEICGMFLTPKRILQNLFNLPKKPENSGCEWTCFDITIMSWLAKNKRHRSGFLASIKAWHGRWITLNYVHHAGLLLWSHCTCQYFHPHRSDLHQVKTRGTSHTRNLKYECGGRVTEIFIRFATQIFWGMGFTHLTGGNRTCLYPLYYLTPPDLILKGSFTYT